MKRLLFISLLVCGCASIKTPYETCQENEEWKHHGTMDYCVADVRQKELLDAQARHEALKDMEETGESLRKVGSDMQNNNPWGKNQR